MKCGTHIRSDRRQFLWPICVYVAGSLVLYFVTMQGFMPHAIALPAYLVMTTLLVVWLGTRPFVLAPPDGCFKCHYDLRGIESDKCPECGTAVVRET